MFRQFKGFFVTAFLSSLRSPSAVFFGFFFPLIFLFSFAFINNSEVVFKLGVVRGEGEIYSIYLDSLSEAEIFNVDIGSKDNLTSQLSAGEVDAVVEIEDDFNLILITNSNRPENNQIIFQAVSSVNDKVTLGEISPILSINQEDVNGRSGKYIDFVLPGILGFAILASVVSGTSFSFVSLKKTLALKRLFSTPASVNLFILGQSLARLIFSLLQNIFLLVLAITLFGYEPRAGISSLLQIIFLIIMGIVMFLGMGYVIAGMVSNEDQIGPITNIVTLPQFLLASTFFPITTMPNWLQSVSKLLPLYNFNTAIRFVSLDGLNLWSPQVLWQILYMTIWIVVVYAIANRVFNIKSS